MNNDLISRSELKKAIKNTEYFNEYAFGFICDIIDNAPTVEPTFGIFKSICCEDCDKTERPQGKWIEKHCDYGVYYRCSNCHKMPPNYECDYKEGAIKTNFCPNCGAEMRKGEEE